MRLVILGSGGYGRTVAEIASGMERYSRILFLDDNDPDAEGKLDSYTAMIDPDTEFYPAFGNNTFRMEWIRKLKADHASICTLIHPSAYVSPTAQISEGTVILPNASIGTGCIIKEGCIINMNAAVDHDCILEEGVHVCLGAIVKAGNRLEAYTKIEAGQVIQRNQYPAGGRQ